MVKYFPFGFTSSVKLNFLICRPEFKRSRNIQTTQIQIIMSQHLDNSSKLVHVIQHLILLK